MSRTNGVPKGWIISALETVLPIDYGKGLPAKQRTADGVFPVFGSNGHVGYHSASITDRPTLIVGRKGAAGAVHFSPTGCWPIDTAYFTVGHAGCDLKYFLHLLRYLRLGAYDKSTAIPSLSRDDYNSLQVPVAPLYEQRRIVEKIEELFSDLDAGVAALQRAKDNLKRYRAAVLKAAVEGKLTAAWRAEHPDSEPASKLLERILGERRRKWEADQLAKFAAAGKPPPKNWRARYVEPAPPDTADLPQLPKSWCWATVQQLSTKVVDGVHKKPKYVAAGIPFVTVRNLTAGPGISFESLKYVTPDDHAEFIRRANPQRGDILISKDGTLGVTRAIRTDAVFSIFVSVALVKPVRTAITDFLEIAFCSPVVQRQMVGKGSGLQHIHLEDLRRDCIPLPPLKEQSEIVTVVAEKLSQIEAADVVIDHSLLRAARLRQSILKRAFEGKLVPQDPRDEPATVLLERLSAKLQKAR